jgi:5-methylcytosine-specific restriction enzyme subunit McrC
MANTSIYEFEALLATSSVSDSVGLRTVPPQVFAWLESQALRLAETGETPWLRLSQRQGRRAVQVTSFVGVIRAPDGYQIEVLPKVGKAIGGGDGEARQLLIEMLCCLGGFRHIQTDRAKLFAKRMPLLEVFIGEFLRAVEHLVKRGAAQRLHGSAR